MVGIVQRVCARKPRAQPADLAPADFPPVSDSQNDSDERDNSAITVRVEQPVLGDDTGGVRGRRRGHAGSGHGDGQGKHARLHDVGLPVSEHVPDAGAAHRGVGGVSREHLVVVD